MDDLPELEEVKEREEFPLTANDDDEEDEDDTEIEEPEDCCVCFLCDQDHSFDFSQFRKTNGLDFYATLCTVNFLRSRSSLSPEERILALTDQLALRAAHTESAFTDAQYLQPVLANDPALYSFDDDENDADDDDDVARDRITHERTEVKGDDAAHAPVKSAAAYENELRALRAQIDQMTTVMQRIALDAPLAHHAPNAATTTTVETETEAAAAAAAAAAAVGSSRASASLNSSRARAEFASPSLPGKKRDQGYFDAYGGIDIHEEMLRDTVRTLAYRTFMFDNRALFQDKVVLDVGCGTGILCLFAADAGARQVVGIDRAAVVERAAQIVAANGRGDRITLVNGRVEELERLPVDKVDIIVSEWMGYALLFESMLSTVLHARDRWLAPGGVVHPSRARLLLSALDLDAFRPAQRAFFNQVYGYDMRCMVEPWPEAVVGDLREPLVEVVPDSALCSLTECIRDIDIMTVTDAELDFSVPFSLRVTRAVCALGGLVLAFDTTFAAGAVVPHVVLDTSASAARTHWKQTVLFLPQSLRAVEGDLLVGSMRWTRPVAHPRGYDIVVEWALNGAAPATQLYEMY